MNLRSDLLKQVDERVQERMQDYLDRAGSALNFLETAVFLDLDLENDREQKAALPTSYLKQSRGSSGSTTRIIRRGQC